MWIILLHYAQSIRYTFFGEFYLLYFVYLYTTSATYVYVNFLFVNIHLYHFFLVCKQKLEEH